MRYSRDRSDIVSGLTWRQVDYLGWCDTMPQQRTYVALARPLTPATPIRPALYP